MLIELLELKNDYIFKRLFGYSGNEDITLSLLNSILNKNISEISLDCNPILEKDLYDDKVGILDIRAKLNDNIDCDIEMQVANENNIEKRILFYLSKMYSESLKSGKNYKTAKKCIAILFTDFEIKKLKNVHKYITKWNFREQNYSNIILTDAMEIYIIELSKVSKYTENSALDTWVKFINNSGDVDMENVDKSVKKAKEVLEEISNDEHERYLADLRIRCLMQKQGIEEAGFDRGFEKGIKQRNWTTVLSNGIEQGIYKHKVEIAKKLKSKNSNINTIIELTGFTKEEIENL